MVIEEDEPDWAAPSGAVVLEQPAEKRAAAAEMNPTRRRRMMSSNTAGLHNPSREKRRCCFDRMERPRGAPH